MYKMQFDLTNKKDAVYLKDKSDVVICIADDDIDIEIKLTYKQFEKLYDEHKGNIGEPTYEDLEDRVLNLEARNEYLNDLIEQYEEYNDEKMQKYYESQFI